MSNSLFVPVLCAAGMSEFPHCVNQVYIYVFVYVKMCLSLGLLTKKGASPLCLR